MPPAHNRLVGFSLIELLVVIAIVSVLAALAISALAKARQSSAQAACLSQLRQIGHAMNLFANDNDGYYPEGWDPGTQETFASKLANYIQCDLRRKRSVFISPVANPITADDDSPHNITYGMHGLLGLAGGDRAKPKRFQVQRPSQVILVGNTVQQPSNHNRSACTIYAPSEVFWSGCDYPLDERIPVQEADGNLAYPNSRVNCVFVDGHVASIKKGEVTWGHLLPLR